MEIPFKLVESTALFGFVRLCIQMRNPEDKIVHAALLPNGSGRCDAGEIKQEFSDDDNENGVIEAILDRSAFPQQFKAEVIAASGTYVLECADLVEEEKRRHSRSSLDDFLSIAREWRLSHPGAVPKVLDIGGRARSGYLLADHLPGCDVTVLDIVPDEGVDIVADIHDMSDVIDAGRFDFVICVSVFEHLIMPWKAAIEINKVLKRDGVVFVQTHQTVGLHDRPWDYFRFSDDSWKGIFNASTGFEILSTLMTNFVRITPMHYYAIEPHSEKMGGFYESSVVVRKVGETAMAWPVSRAAIVETTYPA